MKFSEIEALDINALSLEQLREIHRQLKEHLGPNLDDRETQLTRFTKRQDYVNAENRGTDISNVVKLNNPHNIPNCESKVTTAWEEMNAVREVLEQQREEERLELEREEQIIEMMKELRRKEREADKEFWEIVVKKSEEEQEELVAEYWIAKEAEELAEYVEYLRGEEEC